MPFLCRSLQTCWVAFPVLISRSLLAFCFIYSSVYVSYHFLTSLTCLVCAQTDVSWIMTALIVNVNKRWPKWCLFFQLSLCCRKLAKGFVSVTFVSLASAAAPSIHSCPTLCDPVDCSQPGSSIHGISQARILKWLSISFSGSLQPRDQTWVSCISCIGRGILHHLSHWGSPLFLLPQCKEQQRQFAFSQQRYWHYFIFILML